MRQKNMTSAGTAAEPITKNAKHVGHNPVRRTILKVFSRGIAASAAWAARPRATQAISGRSMKWVAFYGQTADEEVLASYDIVVLDPSFEGSITAVAKAGARVYAYLSLGEIRLSDPFYDWLDRVALLDENPAWPNTRRVDVRHRSWKDLVLLKIIPFIAARGFNGLMLDTLDTPPYLEQLDPEGNSGMRQAAVDLVRAIHISDPPMAVIMNRGYALLPSVIGSIDGIVAESLLTSPDPLREGGYKWNEPSLVALQLSLLAPALQRQVRIPILTVDYWDPNDSQTIKVIYRHQRQLGHHPYVATPMLDRIISEPAL